jgi:hypothetical protein
MPNISTRNSDTYKKYKSTVSNYKTPENTQVLLSSRFRTHEMYKYHTGVETMLANI